MHLFFETSEYENLKWRQIGVILRKTCRTKWNLFELGCASNVCRYFFAGVELVLVRWFCLQYVSLASVRWGDLFINLTPLDWRRVIQLKNLNAGQPCMEAHLLAITHKIIQAGPRWELLYMAYCVTWKLQSLSVRDLRNSTGTLKYFRTH